MAHALDTSEIVQAGQAAMEFVKSLLANEQVRDVRPEEFQESSDGRTWLITISFLRPNRFNPLSYLPAVEGAYRDYKVVSIDKETKLPVSMKNRTDD